MLKELNNLNPKSELVLPDGEYLYAGLISMTFENGKGEIKNVIGCYHTCDGHQYPIDTTKKADKIMPVIIDLPAYITKRADALNLHDGFKPNVPKKNTPIDKP